MRVFENILALDTALGGCTAALIAGDISAVRSEMMMRGQAEHLVPFVEDVMDECAMEYGALNAVLSTVGPGAFTGMRIGLSTARSFGVSLNIPVFGITTLDVLAQGFCAREDKACSVILETKRKDFYFQHFDSKAQAVSQPGAAEQFDIPDGSVLIGDGVARFVKMHSQLREIDEGYVLPDMKMAAQLLQKKEGGGELFKRDAQPVYLRGADVSYPKEPPRQLRDA